MGFKQLFILCEHFPVISSLDKHYDYGYAVLMLDPFPVVPSQVVESGG